MAEIGQQQRISQEQTLSARQMQSLELLHLPALELQEKINEAMENNPVLEYIELPAQSLSEPLHPDAENDFDHANTGDDAADLFNQSTGEEWFEDLPIPGESDTSTYGADQEKRDHFFESVRFEPSLQDQLLHELSYADFTPEERRIAELIIGSLNDDGLLQSHIADIAMAADAPLESVEKVLAVIQQAAPPGVAARDLAECLTIQLKSRGETDPVLYDIIQNHLDDLAHNRLAKLAHSLKISQDDLQLKLAKIKKLTPHPGSALHSGSSGFVLPEVTIREDENGLLQLDSNDAYIPKLQISDFYRKLLDTPDLNGDDRTYIRQKITHANELMKSLALRQKTIDRIAHIIMEYQAPFLKNGVDYLKPMTMADAATLLDLHETTVSRAIANKYIQTPQGLYEFKFFFSGGYQNSDGEDLSSHAIKEKLRTLIHNENPQKPLSDDKLSELLKQDGFSVARRTIAKYREAMKILPSHLRKQY